MLKYVKSGVKNHTYSLNWLVSYFSLGYFECLSFYNEFDTLNSNPGTHIYIYIYIWITSCNDSIPKYRHVFFYIVYIYGLSSTCFLCMDRTKKKLLSLNLPFCFNCCCQIPENANWRNTLSLSLNINIIVSTPLS